MADRNLKVPDFMKLCRAHGCEAYMTKKQKVIVQRTLEDGTVLHWSQHAHKGVKDSFRRNIVRRSRFRLRFHEMPDDEFYEPLS